MVSSIHSIDTQTGETREILSPPEGFADRTPAFSPSGRLLAFTRCSSPTSCALSVAEVDISRGTAGPVRNLTEPSHSFIFSIAWTSDGTSLVFGRGGPLERIPLRGATAPDRLDFAGPVRSIAISRSGFRAVYQHADADYDIMRIEGGTITRSPLSSTRMDASPQFSPDGTRVVFTSTRSGNFESWVANADGTSAIQLTTSRGSGSAQWSPDGKRIVYDSQTADGLYDIYLVDALGGPPQPLVHHPASDVVPSFSRDGKWVYFSSNRGGGRFEIYRVSINGGEPLRLTDNGGFVPIESLDGRSVYYTKYLEGCPPLLRRSLDGGPEHQVLERACLRGVVVTNAAYTQSPAILGGGGILWRCSIRQRASRPSRHGSTDCTSPLG